jgi:hypothetical protein
MRSYLDFEKPVAELEAKVEELRALQEAGNAVAIGEEITRLESKANGAGELMRPTPAETQVARHPQRRTADGGGAADRFHPSPATEFATMMPYRRVRPLDGDSPA